jgi:type II secretory ATPase GspE/PulE/Tfp pilus assembly ATPase PilB-like protein
MGIPAYLLPAAINAIIAQRLVRRLCTHCRAAKRPEELDPKIQASVKKAISLTSKEELLSRVGIDRLNNPIFYEAVGCEHCNMTGYAGRVGVYEIMEITLPIKEAIIRGDSSVAINQAAVLAGMISLEQDGIMKALCGYTSLGEVYAAAKEN